MIVIVSPSVSASSIACVVSTTTRSRFDFSITSHTPRRFTGSIPVVGSSRYTFGSAISEHATERRRFIPPEYARDGRSAVRGSSSSTARRKVSARSGISFGATRAMPAKSWRCSRPESSGHSTSCCGQMPISVWTARRCYFTDLPKRKASPFVGRNIPDSMLNVVVFPAPLWPRRQNRFLSGMPNGRGTPP